MTEESAPAKILIVEDEALIAREIRHRLTKMGWEVVGTAFGEDAVELALETRPDLLLCDIQLRHGLSGIDLVERIQALMDIPIVFLTAFSDEDTVARAKKVTPFGYIIKPVENRDLQITIEMALYKFRVEKELKEKQQLLETALAWLEHDGPRTLWLGVWSENFGAQRFYARYGFEKAGEYLFPVGDTHDLEFILRRAPRAS